MIPVICFLLLRIDTNTPNNQFNQKQYSNIQVQTNIQTQFRYVFDFTRKHRYIGKNYTYW